MKQGSDSRSNSPGSFAFLFRDDSGASQALPAVRTFFVDSFRPTGAFADSRPEAQDLAVSGLGDEAPPGFRFTLTARGLITMAFTTYLWRVGNVVAGLSGADALGDMTDQTMLDMAKKIDHRATVEADGRN